MSVYDDAKVYNREVNGHMDESDVPMRLYKHVDAYPVRMIAVVIGRSVKLLTDSDARALVREVNDAIGDMR